MTDAEWYDEGQAPAPRRRFPRWLLFGCGCGCLATVLAVGLAGVFAWRAADDDVQWPRVREVLWFDERPDLELQFGLGLFGQDQFMFTDPAGTYQAQLQSFGDAPLATLDMIFDEDPDTIPFGLTEPEEPILVELELQGRTVRALRYGTLGGFSYVKALGPGIRVDVSRPGRTAFVQLTRVGAKEPLTDDEVRAFFAHFDLWRDG